MRVGNYEVQGALGSGGAGSVVRARAPDGRTVAIKLLRRPDSPAAIARFERERRLLQSLGLAQGFVPLLDSGESSEGPWFVMPLLGGGTLRDRLERAKVLPVAEVRALGVSVARACGEAHRRGVVHRDLKPENLLYARPGDLPPGSGEARMRGDLPLVADVGLAKHFRHDTPGASASVALTRGGVFVGTAAYVPPEQFQGARDVGPAADVFAIGAILYECLVGRPAFDGETLEEIFQRTARGLKRPVRAERPDVPRDLADVVERALAVDPEQRFADGDELARALEGETTSGARSLRPLAVGLAVLALACAAATAALVARVAGRRVPGLDRSEAMALLPRLAELGDAEAARVVSALAPSGTASADVARELGERLRDRARRALDQGETARALDALDRPCAPPRSPERALVLALAGRFADAIAAAPDDPAGKRLAGQIALGLGKAPDAAAALSGLGARTRTEDLVLARALARHARAPLPPFPAPRAGTPPDGAEGALRLLDLAREALAADRPERAARAEDAPLASLPSAVAAQLRVARAHLALARLDAPAAAREIAPLLDDGPVQAETAFEQAAAYALAEVVALAPAGAAALPPRLATREALRVAGRRRLLELPEHEGRAARGALAAAAVDAAEEVVVAAERSGERASGKTALEATTLAVAIAGEGAREAARAHELDARARLAAGDVPGAIAAATSAVQASASRPEAALVLARARLARVEAALDEGLFVLAEGRLPEGEAVLRPLAADAVAAAERALALRDSPLARLAVARARLAALLASEPPPAPDEQAARLAPVHAVLEPLLEQIPVADLARAASERDQALERGDGAATLAATRALDAVLIRANAGDPRRASLAVEALAVLARARAAVSLDVPADETRAFEALAFDAPSRAEARKIGLVQVMGRTGDADARCAWSRLPAREEVLELRRLGPDLGITLWHASDVFQYFLGDEWTQSALETPGEVTNLIRIGERLRTMLAGTLATDNMPEQMAPPLLRAADEVVRRGQSASPEALALIETSARRAPGDPLRLFFRAHARTGAFATRDLELALLGTPEGLGMAIEVFRRLPPEKRLAAGLGLLAASWEPRPEDVALVENPGWKALAAARDSVALLEEARKRIRDPQLRNAGGLRVALLASARLGTPDMTLARALVAANPDDPFGLEVVGRHDASLAPPARVRALERARAVLRPPGDLLPVARGRAGRTSFGNHESFGPETPEQERLEALAGTATWLHALAASRPALGYALARRPDRDVDWVPLDSPQSSHLTGVATRERLWQPGGADVARTLRSSLRGYGLSPFEWTPAQLEEAATRAAASRGHGEGATRFARAYRAVIEAFEAAGEAPAVHTAGR